MRSSIRLHSKGLLALIPLLICLLFLHWAFLEEMDALAFDFALRLRGPEAPDPRITIAAIDDASLSKIGPWPWPPEVLSKFLDRILSTKPSVVGVDLILNRSLEHYPALLRPESAVVMACLLGSSASSPELFWEEPRGSQTSPSLSRGHIHAGKDADGVCRSIPLMISYGGKRRWAFVVEIVRLLRRLPPESIRMHESYLSIGSELRIPRLSSPIDRAMDAQGVVPFQIPDHLLINSRGGIGTFPYISAASIVAGEASALAQLTGQIVLVGATSYSLGDHLSTAFSGASEMPGIEIHANALDTILNERFLSALTEPWVSVYLTVLLIATGALFAFWPRSRSLVFFLSLSALSILLPLAGFALMSFWLPAVTTVVTVVMAGATSQFLHYSSLNRQLNERYKELSTLLKQSGLSPALVNSNSEYREKGLEWKLHLLSDATEAALHLSNEREELISFVSHELKTPLTSVRGFAELLQMGDRLNPEDRQEAVAMIQSETERLARLVEDYLKLAKLEHQSTGVRQTALNLSEVVEQAVALMKSQCEDSDVRLTVSAPAQPLRFVGDRELLLQVLLNLLSNALKFSRAGSQIGLRLSSTMTEGILEVEDHGCGIPESELGQIFEKFYRTQASKESDTPGSGLGLAFVQEVVRQHGGKISVTSQLGKGSTFRVALPRADLPPENKEAS